ncbi:MAG: type IV secretion system protein [Nevskia sp.]|nr:type IV secretion system protein [Nevskia sp.]
MSTVFTDFLNNVDLAVNGFLIAGYDRVRDAVTTPLRLCLSVFIAVYGLLLLTGYATMSVRGAFGRLTILLFVYVLATNADFYTTYIEQLFVQAPASIGNILVGGGGTGSQNSAMDQFYTTGMDAGDKLWSRGNLYTLSPLFAAVVVYAITLGVAAYAAFLLALAKIALAVLLILTPLFALCYLYGHTRRLFEGWLSQVIHYAVVPILVYGVLALILAIAQAQLQQIDANAETATFPQVLELALAGLVAILLLSQIVGVAGAIAGGISLTTMGVFRDSVGRGRAYGALAGRRALQWARYMGRGPQWTRRPGGGRDRR